MEKGSETQSVFHSPFLFFLVQLGIPASLISPYTDLGLKFPMGRNE